MWEVYQTYRCKKPKWNSLVHFFPINARKSVTLSPKFKSILPAGVVAVFNLLSLPPVKRTAFFHTVFFLLYHLGTCLEDVLISGLHTDKFQLYYLLVKFLRRLDNVLHQFLLTNVKKSIYRNRINVCSFIC